MPGSSSQRLFEIDGLRIRGTADYWSDSIARSAARSAPGLGARRLTMDEVVAIDSPGPSGTPGYANQPKPPGRLQASACGSPVRADAEQCKAVLNLASDLPRLWRDRVRPLVSGTDWPRC